jgi:hypothetical protein
MPPASCAVVAACSPFCKALSPSFKGISPFLKTFSPSCKVVSQGGEIVPSSFEEHFDTGAGDDVVVDDVVRDNVDVGPLSLSLVVDVIELPLPEVVVAVDPVDAASTSLFAAFCTASTRGEMIESPEAAG